MPIRTGTKLCYMQPSFPKATLRRREGTEGFSQTHQSQTNPNSSNFIHPLVGLSYGWLSIQKVNFSVVERASFLLSEIFDPIEASLVFAGTSAITRAAVKCSRALFGDRQERWALLDRKEDIFEIVQDPKDIPHWWNDSTARTGARRDPTDPREYWCWRRCLSNENPITVQDFLNPNPETWLNGCQAHLEPLSLVALAEAGTSPKSTGALRPATWGESEEATVLHAGVQETYLQTNRIGPGERLDVIEECESE